MLYKKEGQKKTRLHYRHGDRKRKYRDCIDNISNYFAIVNDE